MEIVHRGVALSGREGGGGSENGAAAACGE